MAKRSDVGYRNAAQRNAVQEGPVRQSKRVPEDNHQHDDGAHQNAAESGDIYDKKNRQLAGERISVIDSWFGNVFPDRL